MRVQLRRRVQLSRRLPPCRLDRRQRRRAGRPRRVARCSGRGGNRGGRALRKPLPRRGRPGFPRGENMLLVGVGRRCAECNRSGDEQEQPHAASTARHAKSARARTRGASVSPSMPPGGARPPREQRRQGRLARRRATGSCLIRRSPFRRPLSKREPRVAASCVRRPSFSSLPPHGVPPPRDRWSLQLAAALRRTRHHLPGHRRRESPAPEVVRKAAERRRPRRRRARRR